MLNQIKIICADMLNIEQRRDNAKKKSDKLIASTIAMTARCTIPDNKEMEELRLSLLEESEIINETLRKLAELNELGMKVGMKQMVMSLGGENE
ncbi:MAG: hypothetical protein IKJ77_06325 [Firmicutes bacterium]|nr:hypothetical protein [Bacillota bacterium]